MLFTKKTAARICRHAGEERRRTARPEDRPCAPTAERGARIGALALLQQNETDHAHRDQDLDNQQDLVHVEESARERADSNEFIRV